MPRPPKVKEVKGQVSIKEMMTVPHTETESENPENIENSDPNIINENLPAPKGKKKALEDIYQKKTQLEHILLRPDTYIGSIEKNNEMMWVFDKETETIVQKVVTYVPGLYKIYDEILVNAADHKQRDSKMDTIKIEINQEENVVSVWNNGKGIPVSMHKEEKMFIPTMIFGHLLTSSNYDDEEQKVTGGRNGYGAKLCNIFSTKFTVETCCKEFKKSFKQVWANNMSKASEPRIKDFSGSEFTRITFSPDLEKFKMTSLDDDIVALMSRRAYDIAAAARGVKVYLNGKKVPVKSFKEYVDMFLKDKEDDAGNQIKCAYESVNDRWEIAVALSDKGFQQMSFVNSIATTKGGRHVDYVADKVVKSLIESLNKKKNKASITVRPFQVKNHLWIFVNALIVNPTFDSQTKENMTLQFKSFGSTCSPSDKFITAASKCGILESVLTWAKFKAEAQLQSKCAGKKTNKIKGIPKLEDANDAGTKYSRECTLILTEGDSAKTLAVAGLGVVGRDRYGVFPLKGKLLNVREATHTQILENAEINNVIKILGLQYKKKYDTDEDIKTLRYGKLMIMTDQDHDGSHIKGLLINFIHHNWPTLLRHKFLEEFITPIVKATKGDLEESFYSIPEFEEWKKSNDNWHTYKIKYYKGLGTSTSKEAKEYFQDMVRHRILFKHEGTEDDNAITMAFSKKAIEQRKEWLTAWMEECKRRKELGLPDIYLYEKGTKAINYQDFVNKELVLFSNLDNERSIPSLVDGLKPGQRKVLYTCLKRNDKKEIKVAQLAGSVAEHSAYHHGEVSLMSTIINLAQNYVGSNNINLLKPIGQFGTRLQGGKDAASPRYIFTQLSSLTKFIFHPHDEAILNFLKDDNQKIEPEWYMPIIPMVLVNGAEGIGTGWSTKVPNYNPREIVANIKRMINGEEPITMKPWFKNFLGTIEEIEYQRYIISGEVSKCSGNKYEITELPIRTWTQAYKESVMEPMFLGSEKAPALISDYKEYHTDTTVKFIVTIPAEKVNKIDEDGPHKIFKLQTSMSLGSMVLFDHNGCLKKYNSVMDILREFFDLRLEYYGKRKAFLVGMLNAEMVRLSNQARFIIEKCDGRLTVENKKRKDIIAELERKGYDSDPVSAWKLAQNKDSPLEEEEEDDSSEETNEGNDFDYLLKMTMWSLTEERKNELLKKRDEKTQELLILKKKSHSDLWIEDLDKFMTELDRVEQIEKEEAAGEVVTVKGKSAKGLSKKKANKLIEEALPSPSAQRIIPKIDQEMKRKLEKAAAGAEKAKRTKKIKVEENLDEFDKLVQENTKKMLSERVGSPKDIEALTKQKTKLKQTKLNFKRKTKYNPSDSEEIVNSEDESIVGMEIDVAPRERAAGRRAAAAKVKYQISDDESENSDLSLHSNAGVEEVVPVAKNLTFNESNDEMPKEEPKGKSKEIEVSDTDSEFGGDKGASSKGPSGTQEKTTQSDDSESSVDFAQRVKNKIAKKKKAEKKPAAAKAPPKKPGPKKAPPKKTAATTKRKAATSDDSDEDLFEIKSKKGGTRASANDSEDSPFPPPRRNVGRAKKQTKYAFDSNSESEEDF